MKEKDLFKEEIKFPEEEMPVECFECGKEIHPNEKREDIELSYMTFDRKPKGIMFCNKECFQKFLEKTKNSFCEIAENAKLSKCESCREEIRYAEYNIIDYSTRDIEKFCSDKCFLDFILNNSDNYMKKLEYINKLNLEIPTECEKCKKIFDLKPFIEKEDENKTIESIMEEKFPEGFLCDECKNGKK